MQSSDIKLKELRKILDEAEEKITLAKKILFEQVWQEQAKSLITTSTNGPNTMIEGIFDGEEMIDALGKKYPVPPNYASKSKLIPGDQLKLTITPDGTFIFKQIGPVDRKRIIGVLTELGGVWQVNVGSKKYKVIPASVTYFHVQLGDEVTLIIPKVGESEWGAIENCLGKTQRKS